MVYGYINWEAVSTGVAVGPGVTRTRVAVGAGVSVGEAIGAGPQATSSKKSNNQWIFFMAESV